MRILVIEDERQLAGHVTRALSRHGHCLSTAYDGSEGLQLALNDPPDLIVLDLNLPGLDGLSVLSRLREAQCAARVLILTAAGGRELVSRRGKREVAEKIWDAFLSARRAQERGEGGFSASTVHLSDAHPK